MTKEDFLKQIIRYKGSCEFVPCNSNCPYYDSISNDCKFGEERTRVIIAKILLRSFPTQETEIERLKQQIQNLTLMLESERKVRVNAESLQEICKLENQIEKMKCCGNCTHFKEYNEYTDNMYYACELKECQDLENWELAK